MREACQNCGATDWYVSRTTVDKDGVKYTRCDRCSALKAPPVYDDVYFKPNGTVQTDPNLCDPKTGREIPFASKGEKAAVMKRLGLRQAKSAERHHGSRNEMYLHRKKYFI